MCNQTPPVSGNAVAAAPIRKFGYLLQSGQHFLQSLERMYKQASEKLKRKQADEAVTREKEIVDICAQLQPGIYSAAKNILKRSAKKASRTAEVQSSEYTTREDVDYQAWLRAAHQVAVMFTSESINAEVIETGKRNTASRKTRYYAILKVSF